MGHGSTKHHNISDPAHLLKDGPRHHVSEEHLSQGFLVGQQGGQGG
jgi:hypothetical protein